MSTILRKKDLPYCKGCGHDLIAKNTAKALERMGLEALDVTVVTDIGCHGIIDGCLNTHTVHGLHGRSVALGAGIAMGTGRQGNKIIVFIGDGGSTIGLQHILEAARLNLDMTVVVHNNMLYGMTGGQTSGLTPCGFKTTTSSEGNPWSGYDLCALTHTSGAAFSGRIAGVGDISGTLQEAFETAGFSLIEIVEICPSYGVRLNPGKKLREIMESSGKLPGRWMNDRKPFVLEQGKKRGDLLKELKTITASHDMPPGGPVSVILSGSAGEGVQLAAGILATAAVSTGYHVTQKGSYPVTVGVGFSTAEVIISPRPVMYHGIDIPDMVVITSVDGLEHCRRRIEAMKGGSLFIDSSLECPPTGAGVVAHDFRSVGARNAALFALFRMAAVTGILQPEVIKSTALASGLPAAVPVGKMMELATG